jgi:transposase
MSKSRRTYSAQFKLDTVLEGIRGEKSVAQLCRERGIKDTLYYKWRDQFMSQAQAIFADKRQAAPDASGERLAELERMVGRLALENEILKHIMRLSAWRRCGICVPRLSASWRPLILKWERCIPCL